MGRLTAKKNERLEFWDWDNEGLIKAICGPVYVFDCWTQKTNNTLITKHRGLRITKDAFLGERERRGFNETMVCCIKVPASILSATRRPVWLLLCLDWLTA